MKKCYKKYQEWVNGPVSKKVKEKLLRYTDTEIVAGFSLDIDFGTGGIRGKMGYGTNFLNEYVVNKVSLGIGKYLLTKKVDNKTIVIAYDNRKNSKLFGDVAAKALASLGFKVFIFSSLRPTPELSFAVTYLHCCAGIMITASHNPKEDNGYKLYNSFGAQIVKEEAKEIRKYIEKVDDYLNLRHRFKKDSITLVSQEVDEAYLKLCLDSRLRKDDFSSLKVVYSPSHGTGLVPVKEVLSRLNTQLFLVEEQAFPSPVFKNTKSPNPEDKLAYEVGLKYLLSKQADILLVSDPDCDRVGGCILNKDNTPIYISGNQMGMLLTQYILDYKKEKGLLNSKSTIISTKVSSTLIRRLVDSYNVNYIEVFTGFKNIAQAIIKEDIDFVFGFEESYGYLLNPIVKDKDAVQGVLLICEMVNYYKKQDKTLLDVLAKLAQRFGNVIDCQFNLNLDSSSNIKEEIMARAYNFNLTKLANYKIKEVLNYNIGLNQTTNRPLETGDNLVKIYLEDGSFIAIRPSGTEPKIKTYYSIYIDDKNDNKLVDIQFAFLSYLLNQGTILFTDGKLVERIWGGHYFKDVLRLTDDDTKIGEYWAVSGYPNYQSHILNQNNIYLNDFYKAHKDLFANCKSTDFPILVKIINTTSELSIQVHPDDKYAKKNENGQGKNEGWLILDKGQDSRLVIGHKAKNKKQIIDMIENKTYRKKLCYINPRIGSFYPIPAKTIHSIGRDITLLEIQQSSDITYRVYDYDRLDASGKARPLHIKQSIDCISCHPYKEKIRNINDLKGNSLLWSNPYFSIDCYEVDGLKLLNNKSFSIINVIEGEIEINGEIIKYPHSFIVCYDLKYFVVKGQGKIIVTTYNG